MTPSEPRQWQWQRASVLWLCLAAVVAALVLFRGGPGPLFQELDPQSASGGVCFDGQKARLFCDFAKVYYPQGVSLREGAGAVRGFYYSPFFGACMRLLAELPYAHARGVWFAIMLLALAALVCLPSLLGFLTTPWASLAYVLVLGGSLPLLHDLLYGQVSSILLALIGLSFVAYQRERRVLSALLLGLATAIKFYPALFVILYLVRRDVRALLCFGATLLVCVGLIPWFLFGGHGYLTLVSSIAQNWAQLQRYLESTPYSNAAVTVLTIAGRLWLGLGVQAHAVAVGLSACFGLALLVLMVRSARRADSVSALLLGLALLPFVVRSCWVHYFVFLPLLQLYVLLASRAPGAGAPLRWCGLLGALVSVTLLSYPYFSLVNDADSYYRAGFPFWATLAVLPALCLSQFARRAGVAQDPA